MSLDLLEALCRDPALAGWNGVGFVVQAYQKRAAAVHRLAHRARARDQAAASCCGWSRAPTGTARSSARRSTGSKASPVFTRKVHTDVSYLACARATARRARRGLPAVRHPQRADAGDRSTPWRARTSTPGNTSSSACTAWASRSTTRSSAPRRERRPCRVYAPVGSHETLLAYLVRRLLENGANTSFVNRIADAAVSIDDLIADPVAAARAIAPVGAPHPKIALPRDLFGAGARQFGRASTSPTRRGSPRSPRRSPTSAAQPNGAPAGDGAAKRGRSSIPPIARDVVGQVVDADAARTSSAPSPPRRRGAPAWAARAPAERAERARRRGGALRGASAANSPALIVREAGKTLPNALGDVREAVDFLRYYARAVAATFANATHRAARDRRLHQPVELPDRHLHRPDRRGARRGQRGDRQAGGGDAAGRRRGRAPAARGGRSRRRADRSSPATARSARR